MGSSVECYLLPPTEDAPNSRLPILVYRNVLPHPRTEETATEFLTTHRWERRVGHLPVYTRHICIVTDRRLFLGNLGTYWNPTLPSQ